MLYIAALVLLIMGNWPWAIGFAVGGLIYSWIKFCSSFNDK